MNAIKVVGVRNPIPLSQIMYIIGNGNYSEVYTDEGKHILSPMTLSALEMQSSDLLRIHKGALVNPDYVIETVSPLSVKSRVGNEIMMQDGHPLKVARRRWHILRKIKVQKVA